MTNSSSSLYSLNKEDESLLFTSGVKKRSYIGYAPFICVLNAGICGGYYALVNILNVYLKDLKFSDSLAGSLVSLFFFATYTFALVGGIVADSFLGPFKSLCFGTFLMVLGTLLLICGECYYRYELSIHVPIALLGLTFTFLGNGFLKPSLSAFLGDQFNEDEGEQRSSWFSWFYLTIQIGSIIFAFATPITLQVLPNHKYITFLLALAPILLGFCFFIIFHENYRKKPPHGAVFINFLSILWTGFTVRRNPSDQHWLDKAKVGRHNESEVEDAKIVLRVFLVLVPLPFFWMIFFQMYNLWQNQAQQMDCTLGSIVVPYAESSVLNGIMDLFLIPIFSYLIYPFFDYLHNKCNFPKFTPLKRIAVGHIFTIAALCVAGFVTYKMSVLAETKQLLNIVWIIPQYFLISCGEILLSITAIEFTYAEAPSTMKGTVTAVFQMTTAIGNAFISVLAKLDIELWLTDFVLAGIIFVVFIIFSIIAVFYEYRESQKIYEDSIN